MDGSKDNCSICFEPVLSNPISCYQCMTCSQKVHAKCLFTWNQERKPTNRLLSDDILICPICRQDRIAFCADLNTDVNAEIKQAVVADPTRKGGKQRKSIKSRKSRKSRKTNTQ